MCFLPARTWVPLAPSVGGIGFSLLGSFFTTVFLSYSTRHGSLISTTIRPHALAAPRTGHLSHGSEKVAVADSWGFGESPAGSVSCFVVLGVSGGLILGRSPPPSRLNSRDFGGDLSGCVWPACSICTLQSASLEHACIVPRLGPGSSIGGSNHHG